VIREFVPSASELVSADLVLVGEEDFRDLFGLPAGQYTDLAVTVRNATEVPTVAGKVTRLLPDARPITRAEITRTYDSIFDWRSGLVVMVLTGAVLAFVIVAWDKASGLSAEERREIGILKAIGWETSDVLLLKAWEGAVVSLAAFALGVLLAYGHVFLGKLALFAPVLRGWSALYPDFRLVPVVDPYAIATLFFLTVVPYTVATLVPAWRAATIDPDAVMRA
jgi:ABC-type lipoprotein release transport system permease subunit